MAKLIRFPGGQRLILGAVPHPDLMEIAKDRIEPDDVAVEISEDDLRSFLEGEPESATALAEPAAAQFAITVTIVQDGHLWRAESPQMPEITHTSSSRASLLCEVSHVIHAAHGGKKGIFTITGPLGLEG